MFEKRNKKNTLKINDLIKVVREAHLSNANVEERNEYNYDNAKEFKIKFEKFEIIDLVKFNGFSEEEVHNIEINLRDGEKGMNVYKSQEIVFYDNKYEGESRVYSSGREDIKSKKVEWSCEGNWCSYIVDEINNLELEIENIKLKRKIAEDEMKKKKLKNGMKL